MQKISVAKVDLYFFNLINQYAKKSRFLDFFAIVCAKYLGYVLFFSLIVFAYISKNWQIFWFPFLAGLIARLVINETVYFFYKRKRPPEVIKTNLLIKKPFNASFPSSHAAFFFAISFVLFFYSIPLAIIFIIASCCIGFFRIFCGLHWPSDILGGVFAGFLAFLMTFCLKVII